MLQQLPLDLLARRSLLPERPTLIALTGKHVRLRPLMIHRDARQLFEVSNGSAITLNE